MTPQQYAFDHGISVQEAKRLLGKRRTKGAFRAARNHAAITPRPAEPQPAPVAEAALAPAE